MESSGTVGNCYLENTGKWSEIFVVISPDDSTALTLLQKLLSIKGGTIGNHSI